MPTSRLRSRPSSSRSRRWWLAAALAVAGATVHAAPVAVSADGRFRIQAEADVLAVQVDGAVARRHPLRSLDRREQGVPVVALFDPGRRSFIVAFDSMAELWELPTDPAASPIFDGYVHDYPMGEAIAAPGYLGVRRTRLPVLVDALAVAPGGYVLARQADSAVAATVVLHLVQLDVRRAIARFACNGQPQLDRASTAAVDGRTLLHVPDARGGAGWTLDLAAARLR